MPRLMSVAFTEPAVVERRKTVTRRKRWLFLRVGDRLTLVRKAMGRRPGEPLVRLAEVEVVSVERQPLRSVGNCVCHPWPANQGTYSATEMEREGFPGMDPDEFVRRFFVDAQGMDPSDVVTRIEWRYLDGDTGTRGEGEEGSGREDTGQAGRQDIAAKTLGRGLTTSGVPGPDDVTATPAPPSSRQRRGADCPAVSVRATCDQAGGAS